MNTNRKIVKVATGRTCEDTAAALLEEVEKRREYLNATHERMIFRLSDGTEISASDSAGAVALFGGHAFSYTRTDGTRATSFRQEGNGVLLFPTTEANRAAMLHTAKIITRRATRAHQAHRDYQRTH